MEQAQFRMWMKRRPILKSDLHVWRSSINDSWAEKAFAEDASGNHGGCIWPPRSYSCSFCKREFSSAQALGGHMNVHRRDRARLKQSDLSPQNQTHSFDSNFPDEVDNICDLHPNSSAGSRVSGFSVQENLSDHTNFVCVQEMKDNWKAEAVLMKNPREETYDDFVETDLLMGFNSAADNYSCKRAKKTGVSGFSLLIKKPCLSDRYSFKVPEISTEAVSNSIQEIDLELRLG